MTNRRARKFDRAALCAEFWAFQSDEALVDRPTAGAVAGLSAKSMELLAMKGGGPAYCIIGRKAMYRRGDVIAWLAKMKKRTSTAEVPVGKRQTEAHQQQPNAKAGHVTAALVLPAINPRKLRLAESSFNNWHAVVPSGTTPEDLDLKTEPFTRIASLLQECDNLRLITEDKKVIFDCICVRRVGINAYVRVTTVIHVPDFAAEQRAEASSQTATKPRSKK